MGDMLWILGHIGGICPFMWYNRFGYENYFEAMMLYKDTIKYLFEYFAEEGRLRNQAIAKAILENNLPPFIYMGEDICTNDGPMASPSILDELYFPYLKKLLSH